MDPKKKRESAILEPVSCLRNWQLSKLKALALASTNMRKQEVGKHEKSEKNWGGGANISERCVQFEKLANPYVVCNACDLRLPYMREITKKNITLLQYCFLWMSGLINLLPTKSNIITDK